MYETWRNRLIDRKIDSVTVLKDTGKRKGRSIIWLCQCDCGEFVEITSSYLKRKDRYRACRECNEKRKSNMCREVNIKHGHSYSITYSSWWSMITRAKNKNIIYYENIETCERWKKFENFLEDMGERPSIEYSIDRKDNSLGYFKENCRWATKEEQSQNRRNTLNKEDVIEIKELIKDGNLTQKQIADRFKVYPSTIDWIKKGETWKNVSELSSYPQSV